MSTIYSVRDKEEDVFTFSLLMDEEMVKNRPCLMSLKPFPWNRVGEKDGSCITNINFEDEIEASDTKGFMLTDEC